MERVEGDDFSVVVDQVGQRLLRMALLLTGERAAAEDLTQSCLLKLFARWRAGDRAVDNWGAYGVRTLININNSNRRLLRNSRETPSDDVPGGQLAGPEDFVIAERDLVAALKSTSAAAHGCCPALLLRLHRGRYR